MRKMTTDKRLVRPKRRQYLATIGAGLTAGLAGCATDEGSNSDSILIGANHPLSGSLSRSGNAMTNAARLAAQHVNEDGGISSLDGTELEIITGDNEGSQELGGQVEEQLIDDGAAAIIGCYSSPVTLSATNVSERSGVPHVIDVSVAEEILQERQMEYVYRVSPPASGFAADYITMMDDLTSTYDQQMDTATVVYINNSFGQSIRGTLEDGLPDAGIEVLDTIGYEPGQSNMDTEATRVQQLDADALIFTGYEAGGTRICQSLENINYRPDLLTGTSTPTFTDSQIVSEIGEYTNGGFGNNYQFDLTDERSDRIFEDYENEFGEELGISHASMSYACVFTIAEAIEQAGSDDPEEINQALKEVSVDDHPVAMGPIDFRDDGENENSGTVMFQVQDQVPEIVWPEQYQQAEPQFN